MEKLLLCVTFILLHCFSNGNPLDDRMMEYADYTLQDLLERYEKTDQYNFWHPNTFKTGVQSREVVKISAVTTRSIPGVYKEWKVAKLGMDTIVVGLTSNTIDFYNDDFRLIGLINTTETLVALTTFGLWNDYLNKPELIVVVATNKPSLESYSFSPGNLTQLGTWPLQNKVKSLEICVVDLSTKIVVIPEYHQARIYIYNFEARQNSSQFWFFQQLNIGRHSCVSVHEIESSTCSIAIASDREIVFFLFEPKIGRFQEQNSIGNVTVPCHQMTSLSLSYSDYLAYVPTPESQQPVQLFSESGINYLNQDSAPIQALELVSLPVGNIRNEDILLLRTPYNTTKILSYDGLQKNFQEHFICTPDSCPPVSHLTHGFGALINGTTVYLVPTQEGQDSSIVYVIASKIDEYTSPVYERARQLYKDFRALSEVYVGFQNIVAGVTAALQDSLSWTEPNVIRGNWTVKDLSSFKVEIFDLIPNNEPFIVGQNFEIIEFINTQLHTEDFTVNDSDMDAQLNIFESLVLKAEQRAAKTIPLDSSKIYEVTAVQKIDAFVQASSVVSKRIQLSGINDVTDLETFFSGLSLSQNSNVEIRGKTQFNGGLTINNLKAIQLNGVPINYFALLSSENIFNTSIIFENPFTVLGHLSTYGLIAGLNFPQDLVLASNMSGVIMRNNLISEKAELVDRVGSILIDPKLFEENILLKDDTPQNITSHIKFSTIVLRQNGTVTNLNGHNFPQTAQSIVLKSQNRTVKGFKNFIQPVVSTEFLAIINTLNLQSFPTDYVSVQEKNIVFYGSNNFSYISTNSMNLNGAINHVNTKNIVQRSSPGEFIPSEWTLWGPVYFADDLLVKKSVAGANVSNFHFHDTFDVPKSQYFPNHNIRFEGPVVLNNFQVLNTINQETFDESFGNALLCPEHDHGENIVVPGVTTIQNNANFGNLYVKSNQVNGINLDDFFSRSREQNITENFIFTKPVSFSNIFALSNVDGIHLQDLFKDTIPLNNDQVFPPALVFKSMVSLAPVTITGPINDFANFESDVALKTGPLEQTFQSHLVLTDAQVKNLDVTENISTINYFDGLNVTQWSQDRVSLSKDTLINQPIEILGNTLIHQNIITDSINNVSLSYLDDGVLRKDRDGQIFNSAIQNTGKVLVNNSQFHQSLNGYSLADIIRDSVLLHGNTPENITGQWHFENAVFHKIYVNGTTCGVNLLHLSEDSVRVNSTNVTFVGTTTFERNLHAQDKIQTVLLDAVDFFNTVFILNTSQDITAEFIWKNDVHVQGPFDIEGNLNNISLKHLNSLYAFQNGTHVINSDIKFDSSVTFENMIVTGLIQEKNMSNFLAEIVPKDSPTIPIINGNLIFTQPIESQGDIVSEAVNNVRLSILAHNLIKKDSTFTFTHPVCFSKPVVAESLVLTNGDIHSVNNLVDLIDIQKLQVNSIPLYSDEPIYLETLNFQNLVVDGNIEGVGHVNGIPISEFITLDSQQNIESLKVSKLILTQRNITVEGLFGGVDIVEATRNTVLNYNNGDITGNKNFTGVVTINGEFHCLGSDNMDQFVYIQEPEQVIQSPVIFLDTVTVKNLELGGNWNNFNLKELKEYGLSSYGDDVISADWIYSGGIVFNNYTVSHGLIDGLNITELENESRQKIVLVENVIDKEHNLFSKLCHQYQHLYQDSAHSPIKLQSFDEQQFIISERRVSKMLTVKTGSSLFLLVSSDVCGIFAYKWSIEFEQFHQLGLVHVNETVNNWAQESHLDFGIIVFSSSSSNCYQNVEIGLYFILVNDFGSFTPKFLIQTGPVIDFKLVTDESRVTTLLFVIYQEYPQDIVVYSWLHENQTFIKEMSFSMSSQVKIMDINRPLNDQVEILIQTPLKASIHLYSLREKTLTELNQAEFYGSSISTSMMKLFQADDSSYALILMRHSEKVSIKPDSNLQLFKVTRNELEFVQKLKIYDMLSMEILRIGHQVFVVVLTKPVGLYVYKFMGLSGLQAINHYPLKFHYGETLNAFHVTPWRYNVSLPFILVSSRNTITLLHSNILGNAVNENELQNNYDCNF